MDSFFEEVAAFQSDRNADVRKFVVGFIEEACRRDHEMLPRLLPNIQLLIQDQSIAVFKRVIQAASQVSAKIQVLILLLYINGYIRTLQVQLFGIHLTRDFFPSDLRGQFTRS